ncbi:hypothetical protein, partial [Streptoalloteichus tenebrarius]|uniref:hypothetical protein n=1 Tax=Streptoalloteichus tenebrarius (strain ATCC 17920 / DSM 40477 / JCM 4838 / CBS 697.72 / NBRC 16177 / NCIMB 11028 / NRRL B-12390 / A12253. 1 / ISP 5477) TaxID=1933 RepID=UPI0035E97CF1
MTNRFAPVVRRWARTLLEPTQTFQLRSIDRLGDHPHPHHRSGQGPGAEQHPLDHADASQQQIDHPGIEISHTNCEDTSSSLPSKPARDGYENGATDGITNRFAP